MRPHSFSLTLAWRYIRSGQHDVRAASINTMIRICFFGIAIGACALTLVLCVMQGFEHATQQKLQSLNPTIMIRSVNAPLNAPAIARVLDREFPTISASAPTMQQFVIIKEPNTKALSTIITLKAIDPAREQHVSALGSLVSTHAPLAQLVHDKNVLISAKLAHQLKLAVGDQLTLLFSPDQEHSLNLQSTQVTIGGLFNTGIEDVDLNLIIAHLELAHELFPEQGIDEIGLALTPAAARHPYPVIQQLKQRFNSLEIVTWHDLYPALVSALKLEKYAMFFVVMLISLVACMNIISLLFMFITHKQRDIAILKAYGISNRAIRTVFFWIGMIIGCTGAASGLVLAWLIGLGLTLFPFIKLPDIYYATYLPIELDLATFAVVFGTIVLLTLLASLIPLRTLKYTTIAEIVRFEG